MKKKICLVLVGAMCLTAFASCGKGKNKDKKDESTVATSTSAEENDVIAKMKDKYRDCVKVSDYNGVEYVPVKSEVTDEEIEQDRQSLINQGTTHTEDKTKVATYGDAVNIDYTGYVDDQAFENGSTQGQGTQITLGSSGYIDNFDEQIVGHKPGDKFDVNVTFPDPYSGNTDLSGKKARFETTLNSIIIHHIPEYNDELVKNNTSYENVAEYEKAMKEKHEEEHAKNDLSSNKNSVISSIIESSEVVQYPEEEVKKLIDQMISQVKQLAESNNVDFETIISYYYGKSTEDEFKEYISDYVRNYIKEKMILVNIADKENISVTADEYDAKKSELKKNYNIADDKQFDQYYSEEDVYYMILSDKVIDFAFGKAKAVDKLSSDKEVPNDNEKVLEELEKNKSSEEASTGEATTEAASVDGE